MWLCQDHASAQFQTRRGGRDFVTTLGAVWKANDCLTTARSKALTAHLESQRGAKQPQRPRPGSYAWPDLRRAVEAGYAAGATPGEVAPAIHARDASCPARPPSRRTIQRWHAQRRWLAKPP